MATPQDTEKDTGLHDEARSAVPGTQGQANAGAREHEEAAPRTAWTSAAPGSQGEANTRARFNRRGW
jgi:hypothetical protein